MEYLPRFPFRSFLAAALVSFAVPAGAQPSTSIMGSRVECTDGFADDFYCDSVNLLSLLHRNDLNTRALNDLWGWTDPESGNEYALVGMWDGVAFVDVTDPINPVLIGTLPSHDSNASGVWRDLKVYDDHVFVVVDVYGSNGMQVFDLTELRSHDGTEPVTFSETAHYDGITEAHNIAINEDTGFAYLVGSISDECGRGLHMVNIQDVLDPTYAGCFNDDRTGNAGNGYTHDVQCVIYNGPDDDYVGQEICFGANVNSLSIADVTDKDNPVAVSILKYPNVSYAHQGWLTDDHKYFLLNDEADEANGSTTGTRTLILDVIDLDDPVSIEPYVSSLASTDHNLYIVGDYVFEANYMSGLRILDISDIYDPKEVGWFDTEPNNDDTGYDGAWSVYPFFQSGTVIVSSQELGLFVLEPVDIVAVASTDEPIEVPAKFALSSGHPNPFNPSTALTLFLPEAQSVHVAVYDLAGREIALLHDGPLPAGAHMLRFDAGHLTSGTFLIRATGPATIKTTMVTLAK